jgi:hypothetical protein
MQDLQEEFLPGVHRKAQKERQQMSLLSVGIHKVPSQQKRVQNTRRKNIYLQSVPRTI